MTYKAKKQLHQLVTFLTDVVNITSRPNLKSSSIKKLSNLTIIAVKMKMCICKA